MNTDNSQALSPQTDPYRQIMFQGMKHFQCIVPNCQKMFRFKSDMERHLIVHSDSKPHVCTHPGCNKTFKRLDALKNHIASHDDAIPSVCPYAGCGIHFNNKSSLQFHMIKHQAQFQSSQVNNAAKDQDTQAKKKASKPTKKLNTLEKAQPVGDDGDLSSDDGFGDSEDEAECLERIKDRKGYQTEKFIEQAVKDIKNSLEVDNRDTRAPSECSLSSASSTHGCLEQMNRVKPASAYGVTQVLGATQCLERLHSENTKIKEKLFTEHRKYVPSEGSVTSESTTHGYLEQLNREKPASEYGVTQVLGAHQCLERLHSENAKMKEKIYTEHRRLAPSEGSVTSESSTHGYLEQLNREKPASEYGVTQVLEGHQCLARLHQENAKMREKIYTEHRIPQFPESFSLGNAKVNDKAYEEKAKEVPYEQKAQLVEDDFKFLPDFEGLKLGAECENKTHQFGFEYFVNSPQTN